MAVPRYTVRDALHYATGRLQSTSAAPRSEAELILRHLLETDRVGLYLDGDRELDVSLVDRLNGIIESRVSDEPLQYLLGSVSFLGVELAVKPGVLIPRPETECLAALCLEKLEQRPGQQLVLDMCAGSGAIAVSLLVREQDARAVAVDLSEEAISLIAKNAKACGVSDRIEIRRSDLFESIGDLKNSVDLLVSNPPYIPSGDIAHLPPNVRREPVRALDGGEDGLDYYRAIASKAPLYIKSGGMIALEVGDGQAGSVSSLLSDAGFERVETAEDTAGVDRIVVGWKKQRLGR